jgi:hypothetical protein
MRYGGSNPPLCTIFAVSSEQQERSSEQEAVTRAAMSESQGSLNPAASVSRMYFALGVLVVLGLLSWFTIDASAVVHVHGYSSRLFSIEDRDVPIRWVPILFLGLFAFRVVLAHMRARMVVKSSEEG